MVLSASKAFRFYPQGNEEALIGFELWSDMARLYLTIIALASKQRPEWRGQKEEIRRLVGRL